MLEAFLPLVIAALLVLAVVGVFYRSFRRTCGPDEVLVISGLETAGRPYRLLLPGQSTLVKPFIERVIRLDLAPQPVSVRVRDVYAKGGTHHDVSATTNVRISTQPDLLDHAVQRFLAAPPATIAQVAQEVLDGHVRLALAEATVDDVGPVLAETVWVASDADLRRLGLHIDPVEVQRIEAQPA